MPFNLVHNLLFVWLLLIPLAVAQTRDLEKYEKLVFLIDTAKESAESQQTKAREFIWNCWMQKRLCYTSLRPENPSGPPNLLELYVEPNEKGEFQMIYVVDAQLQDLKGNLKKERYQHQFASTKVSRVEVVKGREIKPLKIPDTQPLPPGDFRIFISVNKNPVRIGAELLFKNGSTTGGIF